MNGAGEHEKRKPNLLAQDPDLEPDRKPDLKRAALPAWFMTVSAGLALAFIILGTNIGILIWVHIHFDVLDNIAVVFTGACSKTTNVTGYAELAINIVYVKLRTYPPALNWPLPVNILTQNSRSTLLLAASNNCSQLLIAPTRPDVDKAHAEGRWLHIGVASLKNFMRI
jgi:hypothetical protein